MVRNEIEGDQWTNLSVLCILEPRITTKFPMEYLERVKTVHSKGGYGSRGYRYDWKLEEAEKNLLRTHTTATSARMLYNLMQEVRSRKRRPFKDKKLQWNIFHRGSLSQ